MLVLLHKKTNKVIAHCFPPLSLSTKEAQPDDLEETLNNVVCYYLLISFFLEWIGLNRYNTRFELSWGSYSNELMCYSYLILTRFDWLFKLWYSLAVLGREINKCFIPYIRLWVLEPFLIWAITAKHINFNIGKYWYSSLSDAHISI